jgi:hypothetical protein
VELAEHIADLLAHDDGPDDVWAGSHDRLLRNWRGSQKGAGHFPIASKLAHLIGMPTTHKRGASAAKNQYPHHISPRFLDGWIVFRCLGGALAALINYTTK